MKKSKKEKLVEKLLVENYIKYYRLIFHYVYNEQDTLDIVQEGAYQSIMKCDTLSNLNFADTWICKIMINEALQFVRKKDYKNIGLENIKEVVVFDQYENLDLKRAMAQLDLVDQTIVMLRFFEDMKLGQIAEVLEENVNTVKTRLYRAMKKLRIILEEEESHEAAKQCKQMERGILFRKSPNERGAGYEKSN